MKSKRLKDQLVRSLYQTLDKIEQWYPAPKDDEMDWQHEEEILVTQPLEVHYIWDSLCSGGESSISEESGQGRSFTKISCMEMADGSDVGKGLGFKESARE